MNRQTLSDTAEIGRRFAEENPDLVVLHVWLESGLVSYTLAQPFEVDGIYYVPPTRRTDRPMLTIKSQNISYNGLGMGYPREPEEVPF